MTEVIGDILMPSVIVVPSGAGAPAISGASVYGSLWLSGAILFVYTADGWAVVGDQTA